jgi:SAM-dependent methyltransferase
MFQSCRSDKDPEQIAHSKRMTKGPVAVRPYKWLAEYYDLVFTYHRSWTAAAHRTILDPILPKVTSACDLACGTGSTALGLAAKGIRVTGVDLSRDMCRLSRQKAKQARLTLRVICADMRSFRLPETVDLVLCEYDAVNHVPRKSDFTRVARSVARALRPGGYFYFDVNNRRGFASYWKGSFCIEKPGVVLVMSNGNDASHDRAWSDCNLFIRNGSLWRRHRERVEEVCWSNAEIRQALRHAGFDRIKAWDSAHFITNFPEMKPGCRTHYLARKIGSNVA